MTEGEQHQAVPWERRAIDTQRQPRVSTQQWLELVTILTVGTLFFVEVRANGDLQTQLLNARKEVITNRQVGLVSEKKLDLLISYIDPRAPYRRGVDLLLRQHYAGHDAVGRKVDLLAATVRQRCK